jgi:hypothetical protein
MYHLLMLRVMTCDRSKNTGVRVTVTKYLTGRDNRTNIRQNHKREICSCKKANWVGKTKTLLISKKCRVTIPTCALLHWEQGVLLITGFRVYQLCFQRPAIVLEKIPQNASHGI